VRQPLVQPAITQLSVSPRRWRLDEDLVVTSYGWTLVVPKGRVSDGASIPRVFWPIMDPFELSVAAPFVHDELYGSGGVIRASDVGVPAERETHHFTRNDADNFLYDVAAQEGVWWWRRSLARRMLRWFGAGNWNVGGVGR
jgi:hypothetical protein